MVIYNFFCILIVLKSQGLLPSWFGNFACVTNSGFLLQVAQWFESRGAAVGGHFIPVPTFKSVSKNSFNYHLKIKLITSYFQFCLVSIKFPFLDAVPCKSSTGWHVLRFFVLIFLFVCSRDSQVISTKQW